MRKVEYYLFCSLHVFCLAPVVSVRPWSPLRWSLPVGVTGTYFLRGPRRVVPSHLSTPVPSVRRRRTPPTAPTCVSSGPGENLPHPRTTTEGPRRSDAHSVSCRTYPPSSGVLVGPGRSPLYRLGSGPDRSPLYRLGSGLGPRPLLPRFTRSCWCLVVWTATGCSHRPR